MIDEPREPIRNKTTMFRLLRAGAFGNTMRTWDDPESFRASGYTGSTSLRGLRPGLPFLHAMSPEEALARWTADYLFAEAAPDERVVMHGEIMHGCNGIVLSYSRVRANQREAFRQERIERCGSVALHLLRLWADPSSAEDILALLDLYPDHVVEFTVYDRCLGTVPGRNTITWEVRAY
jgi:hypothetical protein